MTTNEKVARRKLSLLELTKELNNVSKACKLIIGRSVENKHQFRFETGLLCQVVNRSILSFDTDLSLLFNYTNRMDLASQVVV